MDRQRIQRSSCPCTETRRGVSPARNVPYSECGLALAIATVPMQKAVWSETYAPDEALCKGTVFPELYLPFVGSGR